MKRKPPDPREAARRAALNALKKARRAAERAGVKLSEWEGEFLGSVEGRVKTYGRAFGDPEKGAPGASLSMLQTLKLAAHTSPYGLTGAVFANERTALVEADRALQHAAGNFYINDKPTGAVVGQQPFGGGRASGTNDKAGSWMNLLRWTSPRVIKETYLPQAQWRFGDK